MTEEKLAMETLNALGVKNVKLIKVNISDTKQAKSRESTTSRLMES